MTHHGMLEMRGINAPRSRYHDQGKFGRLFPNLPPLPGNVDALRNAMSEIGKAGGLMDSGASDVENPTLPAGFTFFGQFIDHDVTLDTTSSLEQQNDPEAIQNFRTPLLELDNVYGSGPAATPQLYDNRPDHQGKLLIDQGFDHDLPRNSQGTAVIGDPRNDENVIVSQIQLAFLKFHNKVVDHVVAAGMTPAGDVFAEAQRLVRWHYQWIVVHDFLPRICGQDVVDDVLELGRSFYSWRNEPFIPVEFAVAAYRFGHSQVRARYQVNDAFEAPIFGAPGDPDDLSGGRRLPAARQIDWKKFLDVSGSSPQAARKTDTKIASPLLALPFTGAPNSLAVRNLLRGITFSLPSGQAVAQAMSLKRAWKRVPLKDVAPLPASDFHDLQGIGAKLKLSHHTPLWFYLLREADVRRGGKTLGPVGGRIVAEVLLGLLDGDRLSYRRACPTWAPELPSATAGTFTLVDLLRLAGVVS